MSEHNHTGDCGHEGCDCGHEHEATVTLTMDDGSVLECAILTIFPVQDKQYIALLPLNEATHEAEDEVFLYRFIEKEGSDPELENILDDSEYELVADAFDEMLDNAEFDELYEENEETEEE